MKVIIVGLGQTGMMLADILSKEKHDVITVDSDATKVDYATNNLNVSGVTGSGVAKEVLLKAGADTADVIIAITSIDEVNLMICKLAKNCGTKYSAARIYQPELSNDKEELAKEFAVDYLLNPKLKTADSLMKQINLPAKVKADAFFGENACIIRVKVENNMFPKEKMSLMEIKKFFGADMLVGTVSRGDEIFVPKGDFVIEQGDTLGLLGSFETVNQMVEKIGLGQKKTKNIFVIGAGDIAYYLTKNLVANKKKVTLLDNDKARCMKVLNDIPEAKVCFADGLKEEVLVEEGMKNADVVISLTGSDENNLVISLFAWSQGIETILTRVNSLEYEKLLNKVSVDITVSPSLITVESMTGFVRNVAVYNAKGKDIKSVHILAGNKAEAVEFIAYEHNKCINKPMKELGKLLKKGILIGTIIRECECIIPNGETTIKPGDRVVALTVSKKDIILNTLDDILK